MPEFRCILGTTGIRNQVAVDAEVEVEVGADYILWSTTQMGRVIAWPTSSTPCASHVTW